MNFDRVATIYDATRGLPDEVTERVADRIVTATHAGPDTRFLELGVGTGRVAVPLIRRGYPFTGVDVSFQMLGQLREKAGDAPNLTVLNEDITRLSVPDGSQDVVLVVHVFHLVPEWRRSLAEARRVLTPDGHFIWGGNHLQEQHPGAVIRRQWSELVRETGTRTRPRYAEWGDIQAEVTEQGGRVAVYRAAQWQTEFRPIDLMEALRRRTFSATWDVPEDVLESVHQQLIAWGRERFEDLERPVQGTEEFMLFVSWF